MAEMLKAVAKFPGPGFSVLPWLVMDAVQSEIAVNMKADVLKC